MLDLAVQKCRLSFFSRPRHLLSGTGWMRKSGGSQVQEAPEGEGEGDFEPGSDRWEREESSAESGGEGERLDVAKDTDREGAEVFEIFGRR